MTTYDPPSCIHGYSGNGAGCDICELGNDKRWEACEAPVEYCACENYLAGGSHGCAACGCYLRPQLTEEACELMLLRCQADDVAVALGDADFMDPPDGGSVSLAEQVGRMRNDYDRNTSLLDLATAMLGILGWDFYEGCWINKSTGVIGIRQSDPLTPDAVPQPHKYTPLEELLRDENTKLLRIFQAAKPFALLMIGSEGRIPTEQLSFADWHELTKAVAAFDEMQP